MDDWLPFCRDVGGEDVGVEIAEEQQQLEEDEAGHPDGGRASEGGQDLLCSYGFDEKEQEGGGEDGCAIENAG